MAQQLRIKDVLSVRGFTIGVRLTDGSERKLALRPYLWGEMRGPLLEDREMFKAVRVEGGTLVWPNGADICPDELLETEAYQKERELSRKVVARWQKNAFPAICEFDGIKINIHPAGKKDRDKTPHIHVDDGGDSASLAIADGDVLAGTLKSSTLKKVRKWLESSKDEIFSAWGRASAGLNPGKVAPPPKKRRKPRKSR